MLALSSGGRRLVVLNEDVTRRRSARQKHAAVRIEDVARLAGVSAITISRTINKPDTVSEATRKIVWEAIEETGYIPNQLAGGLASRRTRTVGVIIPTVVNSIFADKVQGMTDVLHAAGYQLLLANSGYSPEAETELVAAFLSQRPSGLVLTGVTHSDRTRRLLQNSDIPIVETWSMDDGPLDMLVGFSNRDASHAMVAYLAGCGYRRIAFVSAPVLNNDRAAERLRGYLEAVDEFGLARDQGLIREAFFTLDNGSKAFADLVAADPSIDAAFFANDVLAAGALFEAERRGIRVPDDIAIAGFDDIDLAGAVTPALTTVRIPRYEIGAEAARLLLERIAGRAPDRPVVDLGFEIVARGSTRTR
ncbi:MAG: LacI family DNA-binding transcriptional regulator [Rhizobiaceae bacterium]|nr:LacI family DNA-binding transcriptional regulator [Rhizobiaceae bacterium]